MKIVIIGTSGHIGYVLNGIKKNTELKLSGIASGDKVDNIDTIKNISNEYNCKYFESYKQMLDSVQPDIAAIATRYDLNGQISLECLNRGINCFTEKAIAHDFDILKKLKTAAIKNKVKIIGMHAMRYTPAIYAAYLALKSGAIGTPMLITGQNSYRFGFNRPEFYKSRKTYGGTILWVASHAIDWTYWMMGEFYSIYAMHSSKNNFNYGECEASAVISCMFKTGAIGTITADFYQPLKSTVHGDDRVRIAGDKGIIRVEYGKAYLCTHDKEEDELPLEPEGDFFGDFCREIQGKGKCRLSMEDTLETTRLCLLARQSADTQKIQRI